MDENKKYEFIPTDRIFYKGLMLQRIVALKDFSDVKAGDRGGYVQVGGYAKPDKLLSQEGNCWIYDDSKSYGEAEVKDNAVIKGNSEVFGWTVVDGDTVIDGGQSIFTPRPEVVE